MRRLSFSLLLCLILIVGALPVQAQQVNFKDVDSTITDLMAMYDVPGVALAVVQNGKVTYLKGYGMRNTQTNAPVTEDTLFAIGSVTKSFTALGVSQLIDQGKLDLDTPVITYLPDFKLSDPQATKTLTLRHLMSHSSGLPRSEDWYFSKATLTRKQIIDDMAKIDLTAQPGKLWQYNNQNFVLAGYLTEHVTDQSWEDYTQQHILDVLGMKTANFDSTQSQKSSDYSEPHALDVLKGMQPIPFFSKLGAIAPAGAINASARDMAQYVLFQLGNGSFDGKPLVSEKMLTTMHTQQIAIGDPQVAATAQATLPATIQITAQSTAAATPQVTLQATVQATVSAAPPKIALTNYGYGLGWFTEDYRGVHLLEHGGNIDGFSASVTLIPSAKIGFVLLTNANASAMPEVARLRLAELLVGLQPDQDLAATYNKLANYDPVQYRARLAAVHTYKADPAELDQYAGDYTSPVGKVSVAIADGKLRLTIEKQGDVELVPFEKGGFLANTLPIKGTVFTFKIDEQGTVSLYQDIGGQMISIAQRAGKGANTSLYKDPQGLFTATIPNGLLVQQSAGLAVIQSPDPKGAFIMTAAPATGDTLEAAALKFNKNFDPSFNQKPDTTKEVKTTDGLIWTQFGYKLLSDQLLVITLTQQKNTIYLVLLQAKTADVEKLTPTLTALVDSIKPNAK